MYAIVAPDAVSLVTPEMRKITLRRILPARGSIPSNTVDWGIGMFLLRGTNGMDAARYFLSVC
jgi:hypothetical protein